MTRLLDFDLLPRIKQINKVKLYRVENGEADLPDHFETLWDARSK
ncbi:hypothetical protein [Streptosporangium brasiliense]